MAESARGRQTAEQLYMQPYKLNRREVVLNRLSSSHCPVLYVLHTMSLRNVCLEIQRRACGLCVWCLGCHAGVGNGVWRVRLLVHRSLRCLLTAEVRRQGGWGGCVGNVVGGGGSAAGRWGGGRGHVGKNSAVLGVCGVRHAACGEGKGMPVSRQMKLSVGSRLL